MSITLVPSCFKLQWARCPLIFCFHEALVIAPAPRDVIPPVCPHQLLCVANDASTHHFITEGLSALRVILTPNVPLMYFITRFKFPQSSSSRAFTLVVIKATDICKSWCTCPLSNKICSKTWWNCEAFFLGRDLAYFSSQTLNKLSVAGVGSVVVIYSGNSSNNFFMYGVIDTYTCPLVG